MKGICKRAVLLLLFALCLTGVVCAAEGTSDQARRALIVFFSCTGNTQKAAETLSVLTGAALYEIIPEQPYTADDLNYNAPNSRANREIKDIAARPAIVGTITDFDTFDTIYLGYPIWWGNLPPILRTFLERYDFSGKTVLPFCTSGGSGIDMSVATIRAFLPDTDVREGLRATDPSDGSAFAQWLKASIPM